MASSCKCSKLSRASQVLPSWRRVMSLVQCPWSSPFVCVKSHTDVYQYLMASDHKLDGKRSSSIHMKSHAQVD